MLMDRSCNKIFCTGAFAERRASVCLLCPCDHLSAGSVVLYIVWTCTALPCVKPRAALDKKAGDPGLATHLVDGAWQRLNWRERMDWASPP